MNGCIWNRIKRVHRVLVTALPATVPHTSPVLHLNLVFTIKIFTFTAQSLNGIKYFVFGSRAASFKWPLLSVDVSVCVPATLMLNNSETKQFKGFTSNTNPIGMCLRRVDWLRHRWRHTRRHNPTKNFILRCTLQTNCWSHDKFWSDCQMLFFQSWNRFIELNETRIKYSIKADKTVCQFKGHTGPCTVSNVCPMSPF